MSDTKHGKKTNENKENVQKKANKKKIDLAKKLRENLLRRKES